MTIDRLHPDKTLGKGIVEPPAPKSPPIPSRPLAEPTSPDFPSRWERTVNLLGQRDVKRTLGAGPQTEVTDSQLQLSVAATAALGNGITAPEAIAVARNLERLLDEAPYLRDVLDSDFLEVTLLSEADALRRRIGLPRPADVIYTQALEMLRDHAGQVATAEAAIRAATEFHDYGIYNLQDVPPINPDLGIVAGVPDGLTGRLAASSDNPQESLSVLAAMKGKDRTLHVGYLPESRRVILTASYPDAPDEVIVDAVLDDGITVDNADEAMLQALLAYDGTAGAKIISRNEPLGRQTLFGLLVNEPLGRVTDFLLEVPGTQTATELVGALLPGGGDSITDVTLTVASARDEDRRRAQEIAQRQAATIIDDYSRWDLIATVAQAIRAEGVSPLESANAAADYVLAMDDTEFVAARGDLLDANELEQQLRAAADDRNAIERAFDTTMLGAATVLDYYDWMIHHAFLSVGGLVEGTFDLVGIDSLVGRDFRSFADLFAPGTGAVWEADDAAEFFGWTGGEAATMNAFVSVGFDPLLWFTPGGHGLFDILIRRLTTKEGAVEAARQPTTRAMALHTADAIEAGDAIATVARHADMDPLLKLSLIDGTVTELAAREGIPLNEAVERTIADSLPPNSGTNMLDFSGHAVTRNSASAAALVGRNSDDNAIARFARRALGVFRTQRQVSLSGSFVGDLEEAIFAVFRDTDEVTKAKAGDLLQGVYRAYGDYLHGGNQVHVSDLRAALSETYRKFRDLTETLSPEARRFRSLEQNTLRAEQRLAEIDNLLTGADDTTRAALEAERDLITDGWRRVPDLKRQLGNVEARIARRTDAWSDLTPARRDVVRRELDDLHGIRDDLKAQLARIDESPSLEVPSDSGVFSDLRREFDNYTTELASLRARRDQLRRLLAEAGQPGNRDVLAGAVEKVYYEIGERLRAKGLLEYAEAAPNGVVPTYPVTGRRMHDWSKITGEPTAWKMRSPDEGVEIREAITTLLSSGEVTDAQRQLLDQLDVTGLGALQSYMPVPVSPYEIAMYEGKANPEAWARMIGRRSNPSLWRRGWRTAQRIWASTLLLNIRTMFRSNLDEFYSLALDTGRTVRGRRAAVGLGGEFGDQLIYERIPGPLDAGVRSLFGTADNAVHSEFSRAFGIDTLSPYERTSAHGYDVFQPGRKGHVRAAQWQVNGMIGNDPVAIKVAAALEANDPSLFFRWWDSEGFRYARTAHWREGQSIVPVTAQTAWDSRVKMFDILASYSDNPEFRRVLVSSIANRKPVPEALLRTIDHEITGPAIMGAGTKPQGRRKATEWAFDVGYGVPGGNRASFVHQEYFTRNLEILYQAKKNNGTLLTAERLAEWLGTTPAEANTLLRNAPESVLVQLRAGGMWTPQQLAAIADQQARRRATGLMFQPGAASMLGKKFQLVYPFGPAQADFLSRWGLAATEAATVGLNPTLRRGLLKVPGVRKLVSDVQTAHQIGVGAKFLPLNLRLLGRSLALGGATAHQALPQLREGDDRTELTGPLAIINEATFFPMSFDDLAVIDTIPQIGGVPAYFISMLPIESSEDDPVWYRSAEVLRDMAEGISPALTWNQSYAFTDPLGTLIDTIVPNSPVSVRGQIQGLGQEAIALLAQLAPGVLGDALQRQSVANALGVLGRPTGWTRVFKSNLGDTFERLGPDLPAFASEDYRDMYGQLATDTFATTGSDSFARTANKFGAFWMHPDDYDGEYVKHWQGLVDNRDALRAAGAFGDDRAAELNRLWELTQADDADPDAAANFVDYAADIFFNLDRDQQNRLLVQNPGMAVNAVGSYAPTLGADGTPIHDEYTTAGGRLNLPFGRRGREVLTQGLNEGWIRRKSDEEIMRAAAIRLNDAYRGYTSELWGTTFPKDDGTPSTWRGAASVLDNKATRTIVVTDVMLRQWAMAGVFIDGNTVTDKELATKLQTRREIWAGNRTSTLVGEVAVPTIIRNATNRGDDIGEQALEFIRSLDAKEKEYDANGVTRFSDWSAQDRQIVHDGFNWLFDHGILNRADYAKDLEVTYGDTDYSPPDPPQWSDLGPDTVRIAASKDDIYVVDGDTIKVRLPSGDEATVRLLGINAADRNSLNTEAQAAYEQQAANLRAAIALADSVGFAVYDPVRFGTVQEFADGSRRFLMFLYLDGEPVIDPNVFSARNPVGRKPTGDGIPARYYEGPVS